MQAIFATQQTAAGAIFREQFVQAKIVRGLFAEQFSGNFAIFRDQFWFDTETPQLPAKTYMSLFSSGKVRLVNGRILLISV